MPMFRADYRVFSDLVFPEEYAGEGVLSKTRGFQVCLHNGSVNDQGHVIDLIAKVIGPADDLMSVADSHRAVLANRLDFLSLVTRARFRIEEPIRVISWEPGPGERNMLIFRQQDGRQPPVPNMAEEILTSAQIFSTNEEEQYISKALKYFRHGLLERDSEDQFVKFWHALEIIAESTNKKESVKITCRECNHDLICKNCSTQSMRTPMAKEALTDIFLTTISSENAGEIIWRLFEARNTLIHGGSGESVRKKTGVPLTDIVNQLAGIAQFAIFNRLKRGPGEFVIATAGDFSNGILSFRADVRFDYQGAADHPADNEIPEIKASILTRFPSLGPETDEEMVSG